MVEAPQQIPEQQIPEKPKKKKKRKFSKFLLISALFSPLVIFIVSVCVVLFLGLVVVLESEGDSSYELSAYGEGVIPSEFIPIYIEAGEKYGIPWILIAAVHAQETTFSQNVTVSSAGAVGHFQFLKCTWLGWAYSTCKGLNGDPNIPEHIYTDPAMIAKYGGYGVDANGDGVADPYDIEDAIHSAANLLKANYVGNTEEEKIRNTLFRYNPVEWYVEEVLARFRAFTDMGEAVFAGGVEIRGDKAWILPHTKHITSPYGYRIHPIYKTKKLHTGIDFASAGIYGTPVVSFADGVVYHSAYTGGYGYLVKIDHGNGLHTYYAHLKEQGIPAGTKVKAGQVIGYVGSTGASTGPHLHFEIRINGTAVDPMPYLSEFF